MFDFQNVLLLFSLTELEPTRHPQHTRDTPKWTYQWPCPLTNMPMPPLVPCKHRFTEFFFLILISCGDNTTASATGSNSQMMTVPPQNHPIPPAADVEAQKCAPCLVNVVGGALHQQTMLPRHGGTFLLQFATKLFQCLPLLSLFAYFSTTSKSNSP